MKCLFEVYGCDEDMVFRYLPPLGSKIFQSLNSLFTRKPVVNLRRNSWATTLKSELKLSK